AMSATANDKTVEGSVSSYWVNFAKTGDPNGSGMASWPAFTGANPQVMNLDVSSKSIPVPNLDKLQVLDGYYAWRRAQEAAKP
ncbi:MAG: carboxylesterase family protein, partial [Candidatus Acidiferrales bacterium]